MQRRYLLPFPQMQERLLRYPLKEAIPLAQRQKCLRPQYVIHIGYTGAHTRLVGYQHP